MTIESGTGHNYLYNILLTLYDSSNAAPDTLVIIHLVEFENLKILFIFFPKIVQLILTA